MAVSKQWTRVRTLGRGASGAEVFLAEDDVSGELFAPQAVENKWVSPKSTLDAAFWESESDTDEADDEPSHGAAERRISALACPASALPDWDSDEGWIDVLSGPTEAVAVPAKVTCGIIVDDAITSEEESIDPESGALDITVDVEYSSVLNAGQETYDDGSVSHHQSPENLASDQLVSYEEYGPTELDQMIQDEFFGSSDSDEEVDMIMLMSMQEEMDQQVEHILNFKGSIKGKRVIN
ncbi:unnamed protein product [Triticum turgidum subsp. durum]|uniref:Uncharacterized protein n=1 Tax=Triticum turgidum subsp. durum TaxID=4567 RepID=A0A9R0QF33_TRITD|nr:unnamed protein product [Triticum turgidum subsp. durum]